MTSGTEPPILKPCPFCDARVNGNSRAQISECADYAKVFCTHCYASTNEFRSYDPVCNRANAVLAWNTRAQPSPDPMLDEVLRQALVICEEFRRDAGSTWLPLVTGTIGKLKDAIAARTAQPTPESGGPTISPEQAQRIASIMTFDSNRPAEFCHMFANAKKVIAELVDMISSIESTIEEKKQSPTTSNDPSTKPAR